MSNNTKDNKENKIDQHLLIELSDNEWKEYWSFDHKDIIINYIHLN